LKSLIIRFQELRKSWLDSTGGTTAGQALWLVTVLVIALGLFLRARGYLFGPQGNSLWLDETDWAARLIEQPLKEHLIRPIGFMAITKLLIRVFSPTEAAFRFLAWSSGIATVLMARPLARRLFRSEAARLLFVSVLALDPGAIDLSKEFKPYAVGLALHMGLILVALRYRENPTRRALIVACVIVVPSVLFAQDTLFAYPGFFAFLAFDAILSRRFRHLAVIVGAAAVTLGLVASMYFFIWSRMEQKAETKYWGNKYDVFYVAKGKTGGKLDWLSHKYAAVAETAGERRDIWRTDRVSPRTRTELATFDALSWFVLHMVGLTLLVTRKRWREGLLLYMPLAVMVAFNALGVWPFGPFRANLFTLVYVAGVATFALDREARRVRWGDLLPASLLVLLPLFVFEKTWHARKEFEDFTAPSSFKEALDEVLRLQGPYDGPREELILDHWSCKPRNFYLKYHVATTKRLGAEFERRFRPSECLGSASKIFAEARRALRRGGSEAWMLIGSEAIMNDLEANWPRDLEKASLAHVEGNEHLIVGVKKRTAPEPDPAE
jgi:hypothetical protein